MEVTLKEAAFSDLPLILEMQKEAFAQLYEKYRDDETSPATEELGDVARRFNMPETTYYFIMAQDERVGVIRVVADGRNRKRISPIFIMPAYRRRGYAQQAIAEAERIHGKTHWSLDTILQEEGNCYLYEKLGYRIESGETVAVKTRTSIRAKSLISAPDPDKTGKNP